MRLISAIVLVAACDGTHPQQWPLDEAREAFAQKVTDYSVELTIPYTPGIYSYAFEVVDGQIRNARSLDTGRELAECVYCMTVEDVFDDIQRGIDRDAYRLEVEYDEILSYPRIVDLWQTRDSPGGEYMKNLVPIDPP